MKKLNVAVVFGGRSGEHEVSLVSADSIMKNMDSEKYNVIPIGITFEGKWIAGSGVMAFLKTGKKIGSIREFNIRFSGGEIDFFFPVLHGPYGEDGSIQGVFEMAGVPYAGCNVLASAAGMDKEIMKKMFEYNSLPTAKWDTTSDKDLVYPLFVKPARMGSSVGITKIKHKKDFAGAVANAKKYDEKIIIEEAVRNAREIEVAVLGDFLSPKKIKVSVPGEIIPSNEFYDYNAKYVDGASKSFIPADLPQNLAERAQNMALKAFESIGGEGFSRVDLLLDGKNKKFFVNEINTIPGFTSASMYPKLMEASGVPYKLLIDKIIGLGIKRHRRKNNLKIAFDCGKWYQK